jgi:hypothetical protein
MFNNSCPEHICWSLYGICENKIKIASECSSVMVEVSTITVNWKQKCMLCHWQNKHPTLDLSVWAHTHHTTPHFCTVYNISCIWCMETLVCRKRCLHSRMAWCSIFNRIIHLSSNIPLSHWWKVERYTSNLNAHIFY